MARRIGWIGQNAPLERQDFGTAVGIHVEQDEQVRAG